LGSSFLCESFNPGLQAQVKPPNVLVQLAEEWQSFNSEEAHSSRSKSFWRLITFRSNRRFLQIFAVLKSRLTCKFYFISFILLLNQQRSPSPITIDDFTLQIRYGSRRTVHVQSTVSDVVVSSVNNA